jgi:glycosyltransferase involved in cell wall biosynthesis
MKSNDNLKIWVIQTGETLPFQKEARRMRTTILVDKMIERGHNVIWWTSAFDHFKKRWIFEKDTLFEMENGLKIFALKGLGYRKNISLSRFIDHRIVAWKFKNYASKMPPPDIILSATPPYDLAYQAVKYAQKKQIPIVIDVKDPWPDLFLEPLPKSFHPLMKFVLLREFNMSEYMLKNATSIVSMMESLLKWALQKAGRARTELDKVFYLGAPRPTPVDNLEKFSALSSMLKGKDYFVITFVGAFTFFNNPEVLVRCAKKLSHYNIHFIFGGDGPLFPQIKQEAAGLKNVTFTGWLTEQEINYILSLSHIGVVPSPIKREAFPNKVFTYLSMGLPILSAYEGELREIIEKHQIGFYYPPGDAGALSNCILKLYNDPELYHKMATNAKNLFDEKFDSDKICSEYVDYLEQVAKLNKS